MTHPTDEELEAMAVKIWGEHVALCQMVGSDPETTTTPASKSAAMLRACKTGDAPDHSDWNAAIEAAMNEIDCGCPSLCLYPHACPKDDVKSIRQLKKGSPHD